MRVLVAVTTLGNGGAERLAGFVADRLSGAGHDVALLTMAGPDHDTYRLSGNVARIAAGAPSGSPNPVAVAWRALRRLRATRRALRDVDPDVLVTFLVETSTIVRLAGRGRPQVVGEYSEPPPGKERILIRAGRRATYRRAAAIVVPTPEQHRWVAQYLDPARVHIVPVPLAIEPHPRVRRGHDRPLRVLGVGRLEPVKGFDLLIRAFAKVADESCELRIHGQGPDRARLRELAAEVGVAHRVQILPFSRDVAAAYAEADVFVLSSRWEAMSMAMAEAMASGLAVIAYDCPSGPRNAIRHGVNGLLVPAEDVDELARALDRVLGNEHLRHALALQAQRDAARRFDADAIAARWQEIVAASAVR